SLVVGAYGESEFGGYSGAAYIFSATNDVVNWTHTTKIQASDAVGDDLFGQSVFGLSSTSVLVGASQDNNCVGAAYVFTAADGGRNWDQSTKISASDGSTDDHFGIFVSGVTATCLVVGASQDSDLFSYSGSAYIFTTTDDGTWTQSAKITPNDGTSSDYFFGTSLSGLSANSLVAGAIGVGDGYGIYVGAAYIFTATNDGNWTQSARITATDAFTGSQFGYSITGDDDSAFFGVSISGLTANSLVVGASGEGESGERKGAAYIFTAINDGNWTLSAKITAANESSSDNFGWSVSGLSSNTIASGGTSVAVGDPGDGLFAGAAYVFTTKDGKDWSQTAKITANDRPDEGTITVEFGISLSGLNVTSLVVGAYGDEDLGSISGAAYIFTA
ncbi:unnamed protein product, partial [Heterosigma akashiwo]